MSIVDRPSFPTAAGLAEAIRRGSISPLTAVSATLERIDAVNPIINCFSAVFRDRAMAMAEQAEKERARGLPLGPLFGVPVAVKDMTAISGLPTSYGVGALRDYRPEDSDPIAERLEAAGAIIVGKTTTPPFAASCFTASDGFGVTRNPWDIARSPGGSSGGSAAAVASGCVPLAEGSDMGGSIRIPAALTGIVGLKPSFGRIASTGFGTLFDGFHHHGPLARTVEDAALFLQAVQGRDARDIHSLPAADIVLPLDTGIRSLSVGVVTGIGDCVIDEEIVSNALEAARMLSAQGVRIEHIDLPWGEEEYEAWMTHASAWYAAFVTPFLELHGLEPCPLVQTFLDRAAVTSGIELKRTEIIRARMWRQLSPLLTAHDALLCPTTTMVAPPLTMGDNDFYLRTGSGYRPLDLALFFNMLGPCPALAVPCGLSDAGLPTGVQIVGRPYDDQMVLRIGAVLEAAIGWREWRPGRRGEA